MLPKNIMSYPDILFYQIDCSELEHLDLPEDFIYYLRIFSNIYEQIFTS